MFLTFLLFQMYNYLLECDKKYMILKHVMKLAISCLIPTGTDIY